MKLYDDDYAPNPRRVRIFIAEKGIEGIENVAVSIVAGEHKTPEFRQKNPSMRLPVLELDDGATIAESIAICRYLEAKYPAPSLFGTDDFERAQIEMWQRRMETELFYPIANCFRHTHPVMKALEPVQCADWGELSRERALKRMRALDRQIADRDFIAGDRYTVADITALVAIDFGRPSEIRIQDEWSNLKAWYERVSSRPSANA